MKRIGWIGRSRSDLRAFPEEARRKAGFQLRALQRGERPSDVKPMSSIGTGVEEIRIRTDGAFRIFYVAKFEEAVYVLHAYEKKTQKTAQKDLQLGKRRYQEMLVQRRDSQHE